MSEDNLVIVESPAKARTIEAYLGSNYKVVASYGHIRDLPSKKGSVLPEDDFSMVYQVSPDSTKHVNAIAKLAKSAKNIFLATDPDREGEAIAWHVAEVLKEKKVLRKDAQIKRIAFNEITKNAVKEAIAHPRDIDGHLVDSQQARRALDYLVGFNLSPILWTKLPGSRSAGRVQSVALRLICETENAIELFKAEEYWSVIANLTPQKDKKDFDAKLIKYDGKKIDRMTLRSKDQVEPIINYLKGINFVVTEIEHSKIKRHPKPPFTTSSLQQEAFRKLGFTAKKTMMIAQRLYEGVNTGSGTSGIITYMRTDGVTVSKEALKATRNMIKSKMGEKYLPVRERIYKSKAKNAQEAHEAIRPTDVTKYPDSIKEFLDKDQYKLYDLIWKRMVASQMESATLKVMTVVIDAGDKARFKASGSAIEFDGFYKLYREGIDDPVDEDGSKMLPNLDKGEVLTKNKISPEQHFTSPPPRYSEASLVKKLEELGIGRPSTYASIISVLQDRNYVRLENKRFIPETRGRLVTAFLESFFDRYVEYGFTADLEEKLDHVSSGDIAWKELLRDFWASFSNNVQEVSKEEREKIISEIEKLLEAHIFPKNADGVISKDCPSCNDGLLSLKTGKFGAFVACSNYPKCKYTKAFDAADEGNDIQFASTPMAYNEEGKAIYLKKGPYGFYIEVERDEEKGPKRVSVPKNIDPANLDAQTAVALANLPRNLGNHPEDGKQVSAAVGRFGPYVKHGSIFASIPAEFDVLTIKLENALDIFDKKRKGSKFRAIAEPIREVKYGRRKIKIFNGKYGPYFKTGNKNYSLPKDANYKEIDESKLADILKALLGK